MRRHQRLCDAICIITLVLLLAACARAPDNALRFGLGAAPINLDPRFATDATSGRVNRLVYERLVEFDAASVPQPSLMQWQQPSLTHYRFTFFPEPHRFHDGTLLTANDVKATYDFVLDQTNASPHRSALDMIERIDVPDARTVDFYLAKPDALFPGRLVIGIVPAAKIAEKYPFNRQPLGSGAFLFHAWPEESRLILKRRSDGQLLEFLEVKDPTVRVLKLLRGEIDMLQNDLPPELILYLSERNDVRVQKGSGSNYSYLGFNMEDKTLSNIKVRQAIAYAIDRDKIIRYMLGGAARSANALLPPDHWAGTPDLKPYTYDPERARALLKELGYSPANPLELSYKTSSDAFRIRLATIIQQQLAEVGIDVDLRSYDWGTFYGDIKAGRFQMFSLSWVGIKTPDIFHYIFHSTTVPPEGANRGRYIDARADALIEQADNALDMATQRQAYRALQAYLHEQLPYVSLWYEDQVFIARRAIEGYEVAADGNFDRLAQVHRRAN